MKSWMAVLFLLFACMAQAAQTDDPSFVRLTTVERFAFGPVGYAGTISQGEKDYRAILAGSSPTSQFEKLLMVGNTRAKCYALVGIRLLDEKRFRELSLPLLSEETQVTTMEGCLISRETVGDVVRRIAAGAYR